MSKSQQPPMPESGPSREVRFPGPERTEAIPLVAVSPAAEETVKPTTAVEGTTQAKRIEREWAFLLTEQSYLSEYVRYADQKSTFIFAFSLGSIGFLFKQGAYSTLFVSPIAWGQANATCAVASTLLLTSCLSSMAAVLPRLWSSKEKGVIFWEEMVRFGTADKYFKALRGATDDALHKAISDHCFMLGRICHRKFKLVRYAVWSACLGIVLGVISLVAN